ncbi:MAG: DUF2452 domain-containing protein [Labilithrix sp.]|nr:DUF2452 domain-containing protein [Labilithrix sp.]MCW5818128.1 DUF2452 domain-containing protein [Labilithrix sp.]
MSDDDDPPRPMTSPPPEVDPGRYDGPARAAPYPLSRMAPAFDLVNVAAAIQAADQTLATMTGGKLNLIADQIKRLQAEAHALLAKAKRDAELHRVSCAFEKKPGGTYHLYRRADGALWFSRLAPEEWLTPQPQTYEGTYVLELDQSFTRIDSTEE